MGHIAHATSCPSRSDTTVGLREAAPLNRGPVLLAPVLLVARASVVGPHGATGSG